MDDNTLPDRYLSNRLKSWANAAQPPVGLRPRLLERAAQPLRPGLQWLGWLDPGLALLFRPPELLVYSQRPADWSHTAVAFDLLHSLRGAASHPRLII